MDEADFGRYRLVVELGRGGVRGGMGTDQADDTELHREVTIKVLSLSR